MPPRRSPRNHQRHGNDATDTANTANTTHDPKPATETSRLSPAAPPSSSPPPPPTRTQPRSPSPSQSRSKLTPDLRTHLLHLASKRQHPKTLCPSEVARSWIAECSSSPSGKERDHPQNAVGASWRDLMPPVRKLCFELRDQGVVEVLQGGQLVRGDGEEVRGPIRVRLCRGKGELEGEGGGGDG